MRKRNTQDMKSDKWSAPSDCSTYFEVQFNGTPIVKAQYVAIELKKSLETLMLGQLKASKQEGAKGTLPRTEWYATATEIQLKEEAEYLAKEINRVITFTLPILTMSEICRLIKETVLAQGLLPRESLDDKRIRVPTVVTGSPLTTLVSQGIIDANYLEEHPELLVNPFVYESLIDQATTGKEIDKIHKQMAKVQKKLKGFHLVRPKRKEESNVAMEIECVRLKFYHETSMLEEERQYNLWKKRIQQQV